MEQTTVLERSIPRSELLPNRGKYSRPPFNREREKARQRRQSERGIIRLRPVPRE